MKKVCILLAFTAMWLAATRAQAGVTTTPSSVAVPRTMQGSRTLTVTFTVTMGYAVVASNRGAFVSGNTELGSVNRALNPGMTQVAPATWRGRVSESITIPASIIRRAKALRINKFKYIRNFTGGGGPDPGIVTIHITTRGAADFDVSAVRLYFDNQRAEKTVQHKTPGLQAFADLFIVGSGHLQAYWEVDGRVLTPRINRYVHSGKKVTLTSPGKPGLPTFLGGTHEVRLVIVSPDHGLELPRALYYVTAVPTDNQTQILLTTPRSGMPLDWAPIPFAWIEEPSLATYLIEFIEVGQEDPVFSAYVKEGAYTLPQTVLNHYFSPRRTYRWRIRGFDAGNNPAGASDGREFSLK